ncbi:MAG: 30S ribosomal protein S7 [Candidatus Pacearchaeota archaeon]
MEFKFKLFDLWDVSNIVVNDPGLKRYLNLDPRLIPRSCGRLAKKRFAKIKMHVIERLINMLQVPGHRGKKHRIITRWATGKFNKKMAIVIDVFKKIEAQTNENPIQVFVRAIENASPCDEITTIEYGGARYPVAVDTSPSRRLMLALRHMVWGAYDNSFNKKQDLVNALASEIVLASKNSSDSFAIKKRTEIERQADSAR